MKRLFILFNILLIFAITNTNLAQVLRSLSDGREISLPTKNLKKIVLEPLSAGTYSVGTNGYFPTIDSAFSVLSNDGISGEVTLELIDTLYTAPTDSLGFFLNGPIPGAGPNSRVKIKPAINNNITIEGNGRYVFYFVNTSYLTIDGVNLTGTTTLTVYAIYNLQFEWNSCMDFIDNSDYNIVQNTTFISDDYTRLGGGPGFWTATNQSSSTCDNNLIQNNFIKKAGIAIYVDGYYSNTKANRNIIRGNKIGSEIDSLITGGIQLQGTQNTLVENNIIQNIAGNNGSSEYLNRGINSYAGVGDTIRNNIIHSIKAKTGYTAVGILLSGYTDKPGSNNLVYNNMISNIQSTSTQYDSRVTGIQMWNQNNPKIYYNTVNLTGKGNSKGGSAALFIHSACTNVKVMNNILVNTRNESSYSASAIYNHSNSNLSSDYNNLYFEPNQYNCAVKIGINKYKNLSDWQKTGKDNNSLEEKLNFISPTDLHINNNYITFLDGKGTPIAEILTDFDGEERDAASPDIGADEFDLASTASNWQMQNSNFPADILVVDFSSVNEQVCWAIGQVYPGNTTPYAGYIRTIDGGNNWICDTISGVTNSYLQQVIAIDEDTAYITVYKLLGSTGNARGIYKTIDGGKNWTRQNVYNTSQSGPGYIHFFDSQNGLVIADPNLETYTTRNGGLTWTPVSMPTPLSEEYTWLGEGRITAIGNTVWFSTNRRLFKSTDKGYTWTVLLNEAQYYDWGASIAFQDTLTGIYALKIGGYGTDHIYKKTVDGGATWNTLSHTILDNLAPSNLQHIPGTSSTYIVAGGRTPVMRGTAITYDAGETWTLIDTLGCQFINFASDDVGWGSQFPTNVVYKYVGPSTSVEEEIINLLPTGYSLSQNYPNPFNPNTKIRYSVPQSSKVVIKVFDILGKEITTLTNEQKITGTYELTWNASNLPSGVYFYRLNVYPTNGWAGEFTQTKKMLLVK